MATLIISAAPSTTSAPLGVEPDPTTHAEFDKLIATKVAEAAKLARAAGITRQ